MRRIIIIGGSGFLGQALVNCLKTEKLYTALVMDIHKPLAEGDGFIWQDIRLPLDFAFNADDIVVHLAANQYHTKVPRKNRESYFFDTNTVGTQNILERMEHCKACNMVYFSTDMVYGLPLELPVRPDHPQNPFGPYGRSKKASEGICERFREKGFNITVFRPRMIVGPGRFGILIKLFGLIQKNMPVPMIGAGNNCYQMVSVDDCAHAALQAIRKRCPNRAYNLGSLNPPKVKDLLSAVIKHANSRSPLIPTWGTGVKAALAFLAAIHLEIMYREQYKIADCDYLLDISESMQELGWVPQHDDTEMLIAAYDEYRSWSKQ